MPQCELTLKKPVAVNLVSHSKIRTKSRSNPNIQNKRLYSQALGGFVSLKVATSTIRDMEHKGGFDSYILNQPIELLSKRARLVKKRIRAKLNGKPKQA